MKKESIAIARGDGIGPEIMDATLSILKGAGAPLEFCPVEVGEQVYLKGERAGIGSDGWEVIKNTRAFLKAPITTPQGGGYKSLNVTIRGALSLFANVRPCVSYAPFVKTKHPSMNTVIIRENEEDLYTGIEYRSTEHVVTALKVISRQGSERIIRYAFEYAKAHGRKKVTCFTKDNILKMSDGLFHKVFQEIAKEYPSIENEHWIIDIGAAKLADTPENFDVVVLPNLYGDILSDVAAQIAGSVGLAGSANIGKRHAMFEAIHGSAPRRAFQNLANPSGLILAAVMMLEHLGMSDEALLIKNGWLKTIEQGIHTYDIYKEGLSKKKVGTKEFAEAVLSNLGQKPSELTPERKMEGTLSMDKIAKVSTKRKEEKKWVGIDLFVESFEGFTHLKERVETIKQPKISLNMIANRGVSCYPVFHEETFCVELYRLRFLADDGGSLKHADLIALLEVLHSLEIPVCSFENLYTYSGEFGYSTNQV